MTEQCRIEVEDVFGPQVTKCHNNFDFTLLFEESILYLGPILVASALSVLRLLQLRSKSIAVRPTWLWPLKRICWAVFIILQLVHFIVSLALATSTTRLTNAAIAIGLVASTFLACLSYWEHYRSQIPSTILNVYLLGTIPMDAARARTLSNMPNNRAISGIFIAIACMKAVLLLLEAKEKTADLFATYHSISPEQTAGILNRSFFWWFNPLLLAGYRNSLSVEDLYSVDDGIALETWKEKIQYEWANTNVEKPHALLKVILKVYKWPILAGVVPRLCFTGLTFAQPFLVNRIVSFMSQPDSEISNDVAYGLIAAYGLVYIGIAVMSTMYQHKTYRCLPMVRGGVISLIYQHTLGLNVSSSSESACLTLINADVERLTFGMRSMHDVWASLIELGLSLWLLEIYLGVSAVAAVAVVIVSLAINARLSLLIGGRQKVWLEAIQTRVTTTVAVLGSIKGIKATGSSDLVRNIISGLRMSEIRVSRKYRELLVALVVLCGWTQLLSILATVLILETAYFAQIMAPVFGLGTYAVISSVRHTDPLLAATAFTSLTVFSLMGEAVQVFINAAMGIFSTIASLERVREYLASGSRVDYRVLRQRPVRLTALPQEIPDPRGSWIEMLDASIPSRMRSDMRHDRFITIQDCAASFDNGAEPTISDINVKISRGSLTMIIGPVGCGKSALLKTMLGETPYATGRVTVQRVEAAFCGQTAWLTNTTIKNNILGVSHFEAEWYTRVVKSCALDKDFAQLPDGDNSVIGSQGIVLSGGQKSRLALARALYAKKQFVVLDDVFSGLDAKTELHIFNSLFAPGGILQHGDITTVLATNSIRNISFADNIIILSQHGRIVEQGTYDELSRSGGYLESLDPRIRTKERTSYDEDDAEDAPLLAATLNDIKAIKDQRRTTDLSIYKYYITTIGWVTFVVFLLLCSGFVFGLIFPQIWVRFWTDANADARANSRLGYYLGLYALWSVLGLVLFIAACCHLMLVIMPNAAKSFHHALLQTVMRAPLIFFSRTDSGETSNRFTQDLELIDMELPISIIGTLVSFLMCIGQLGVVVSSSSYIGATIPALIVLLYFVQMFYLRTSRQLRILDIEAKAPLLSHFIETVHGLIDIRAFNWTKEYTATHDELLGRSQRPFHLLYCAQRWLNLTLGLAIAFLAIIFVTIGVLTRSSSGASIGLALVNIVGFGFALKGFVYNWTSLEITMGAIARIRSFTDNTPCEDLKSETNIPPAEWPREGLVKVDNVSAAYEYVHVGCFERGGKTDATDSETSRPVLRNVSLVLQPGEKLAICGRTGSGKSSLIAALLRLINMRGGTLTVDHVDISTVPRQLLRSKLNTLPQDPLFYHASVRGNLDIHGQLSDTALHDVLQAVGLHGVIAKKGGLDVTMSDELLSHGQKQLFCLARALLHPSRILILDEATASVDKTTEALMVNVIRNHFQHHTIICVAHRLQTIMDYDHVIVLDHGEVVERGRPRVLAGEASSIFAGLVRASNDDDNGDGDDDDNEKGDEGINEYNNEKAEEQSVKSRPSFEQGDDDPATFVGSGGDVRGGSVYDTDNAREIREVQGNGSPIEYTPVEVQNDGGIPTLGQRR